MFYPFIATMAGCDILVFKDEIVPGWND